jgi:putative DNA primase/helicase
MRAMSGAGDDDDDDGFGARIGAGAPGNEAGGWDDDDEAPEFSDEDLALRFASQHVYTLRYVSQIGRWFLWTGKVWAVDEKKIAFSLSRQFRRTAARECTTKTAANSVASAKTVAAVERLAQADPRLATTIDIWDADPWLLNTPDGVVELRTGKVRPHNSSDYMTKITTVGPGGDCPRFKAFMNEIMGGDEEMVAFIQRTLGYCLTGDISEEAIFFFYGTGQNGKGVLTSTIEWIMADYCKSAGDEVFTETKTDRHTTELARLKGARVVLVAEVEQGRHWAEARLKKISGGDTITARFMRQNDFQFKPEFKPLISANHKPQLKSVDKAMRRRMNLFPFLVTIPDEKRDNELKAKLRAEGPGILQWMIEGCLEYQRIGLAPPASVVEATDAYFKSEDSLANWISEECEVGPRFFETSSKLFTFWRNYAEMRKLFVGNNKKFKDDMNRLGYAEKRGSFGIAYHGLQIRRDVPAPPGPGGYDPDNIGMTD